MVAGEAEQERGDYAQFDAFSHNARQRKTEWRKEANWLSKGLWVSIRNRYQHVSHLSIIKVMNKGNQPMTP
jgi:hypothetical protein